MHLTRMPRARRVALGGVAVLALGACGAPSSEVAGARGAALHFVDAVATDPARACQQLVDPTRTAMEQQDPSGDCAAALRTVQLGAGRAVLRTTVQGHSAEVVLPGDRVFLSLFHDGWRVVAAGCRRTSDDPAQPAECEISGG